MTAWAAAAKPRAMEAPMSDVIYLGLAVGFFVLSWAFVTLCERV
jgi:hypothetical protein